MIIYKATNNANGKSYIGQTQGDLNIRIARHIRDSNRKTPYKTYFWRALQKYGKDNFTWIVLRICDNIDELNAYEKYYIQYYNVVTKILEI